MTDFDVNGDGDDSGDGEVIITKRGDATADDSSGTSGTDTILYIEGDGILGFTAGDIQLHVGDVVPVGVIVYHGVCRVW